MAGFQDPRCQDSHCHQKGTPVGVLSAALGPEGAVEGEGYLIQSGRAQQRELPFSSVCLATPNLAAWDSWHYGEEGEI